MSDEDLELLKTLDDPSYGPEEDAFHHDKDKNTVTYSSGSLSPTTVSDNHSAQDTIDNVPTTKAQD